jgi:hypothetical protein
MRFGGVVSLVPSTFEGFRLQRAICAAGGPLASLAAVAIFAYLMYDSPRMSLAYQLWRCCLLWAGVGLIQFVPFRSGTARSDGYLIWSAFVGGPACDRDQRDMLVNASSATSLRLRDWPADVICRLATDRTDRYSLYLAYVHFLDRRDPRMAGEYLDLLMSKWSPEDAPEYALEAAFFHALYRGDMAAAREWLDREKRDAEPWVRLRARAAIEQCAGNLESAQALIDDALRLIAAERPCGAYQYEIDRLLELRSAGSRLLVRVASAQAPQSC